MGTKRPAGDEAARTARINPCDSCSISFLSCRALARHRHTPCCHTCTHKDNP